MDHKWILIIFTGTVLVGCGGDVIKFTEPQPPRSKELTELPVVLQGIYENPSDSTVVAELNYQYSDPSDTGFVFEMTNSIEIDKENILNHINGSLNIYHNQLKDSTSIKDVSKEHFLDTFILEYYHRVRYSYDLITNHDTLSVYSFSLTDTLFAASATNQIRKMGKKIYLNIRIKEDKWAVYQVYLEDDHYLVFGSISEDDETVLRRLLEANEEDYKGVVTPSKKTFKEFIKMKGFKDKMRLTYKTDR